MNETLNKEDLVEIDLHFELPIHIPAADKEGKLIYKKKDVAPVNGVKVKVPAYAAESVEALEKFLQQEYEDNCIDMYCPTHPNIWVGDENNEYGGEFKFKWSSGKIN